MGYYPKHLKVQRQKRNVLLIAHAALAGAMFERGSMWPSRPCWSVRYPDGQLSYWHPCKGRAAAVYLIWFFHQRGRELR